MNDDCTGKLGAVPMNGALSELERQWRAVAAGILAFVALGVAVMLLLVPLGSTYDSDCGTILQHSSCEDRADTRVVLVVIAAVVAAVLCFVAVKSSRRRPRTLVTALGTVAGVVALVVVGAPFAEDATVTGGRSFDLHCPGVFTEYGGYEHPPPGTENVCGTARGRRVAVAGGIVAGAGVAGVLILWRARRAPRATAGTG